MEQDSSPGLCKMGCGFYGSQSFEGMCSSCYKDFVKRKQQPSPVSGSASFASTSGAAPPATVTVDAPVGTAATPPIDIPDAPAEKSNPATVDTSSPSSSSASALDDSSASAPDEGGESPNTKRKTSSLDDGTDSSPGKTKKRNRCYTCRKKVGLTGFECRCGGLFCGLHRYSDKHNCTYDYKADGREQIAKANPVIVGEKVRKL